MSDEIFTAIVEGPDFDAKCFAMDGESIGRKIIDITNNFTFNQMLHINAMHPRIVGIRFALQRRESVPLPIYRVDCAIAYTSRDQPYDETPKARYEIEVENALKKALGETE